MGNYDSNSNPFDDYDGDCERWAAEQANEDVTGFGFSFASAPKMCPDPLQKLPENELVSENDFITMMCG